ncbi:Uncharacterised protein [Klebsiella pneumoniae]|nr:Uncharacterised protein [Klebsiella pneumoniae]
MIQEAKIYKENLKSVFAVNRKIVNTAIGRDVGEALSTYETPVLQATVSQRVIFAEAAAVGKAVFELEPIRRRQKRSAPWLTRFWSNEYEWEKSDFRSKPTKPAPSADAWVESRAVEEGHVAGREMKRLTIDIPESCIRPSSLPVPEGHQDCR